MPKLGDTVQKIRSKNAGPFWLTVDIFCGSDAAFQRVVEGLKTQDVSRAFGVETNQLKRFDIEDLAVVKFSLPRPTTQGAVDDRDLHGASWAVLLRDLDV